MFDHFKVMFVFQKYVDDICQDGCNTSKGEDSSYDSDCEAYEGSQGQLCGSHQDVSRTTSDTLAAEYAEYVHGVQGTAPGYNARYGNFHVRMIKIL